MFLQRCKALNVKYSSLKHNIEIRFVAYPVRRCLGTGPDRLLVPLTATFPVGIGPPCSSSRHKPAARQRGEARWLRMRRWRWRSWCCVTDGRGCVNVRSVETSTTKWQLVISQFPKIKFYISCIRFQRVYIHRFIDPLPFSWGSQAERLFDQVSREPTGCSLSPPPGHYPALQPAETASEKYRDRKKNTEKVHISYSPELQLERLHILTGLRLEDYTFQLKSVNYQHKEKHVWVFYSSA